MLETRSIVVSGDNYIISFEVSKELLPFYKEAFRNLGDVASELFRKSRLAEAKAQAERERLQGKRQERDQRILTQMRERYSGLSTDVPHREAKKVITAEFRDYWWLKPKFWAGIRIAQELEIEQLNAQGLNSKEIAERLTLHPGTIRKIISEFHKLR